MKNHKKTIEKKHEYERPRLRIIELLAEEVLGIACHNSSNAAPNTPHCDLTSDCST